MAATLKEELDVSVELIRGSGGIFEVEVDGRIVAKKTPQRGFPEDAEVVAAVRSAR